MNETSNPVDVLNPFLDVSEPQRLLVIAPDEFMPALRRLVQHKNETGMPAVAVSISTLKPFFDGVDDPEIIKKAIRYAHENLGTRYVMLVGDAHRFPTRFFFIHNIPGDVSRWAKAGVKPCEPLGQWFASDLYYANLYYYSYPPLVARGFDSWDANGNGLYNEGDWNAPLANPDNVAGYPDVAVGRVPAHTPDDVKAYVNKIISYESSPRGREFAFVHDEAYGHVDWSVDLAGIVGILATRFLVIERVFSPGSPKYSASNSASTKDVINAASLSNWVSYIGHGGPKQWGYYSDVVGESDVSGTANSTAWPVVFVAGCQTGEFIPDLPWHGDYVDASGKWHAFQISSSSAQSGPFGFAGFTGPLIEDLFTGQRWGVNCPPPGCGPLPAPLPTPNPYDYNRGDQGFAYSWLIGNAPGGAIAYFGEMGVTTDDLGYELEKYLLVNYLAESEPILGDIYLKSQQQYWPNHLNAGFQSASRFYLGWMVFFGDPSLRLPDLNKPPRHSPVPKVFT